MNKAIEIEMNTDQIIKLFDDLDTKKQKQVFKQALKQSSAKLVVQTRKNLRTIVKNSKSKNWWNGESLEQGVRANVWKSGQGAKVNIMRDFRLKFFEMGTSQRSTGNKTTKRKAHNTGRITKRPFFATAKQQTEKQIFDDMDKTISHNILKVWGKQNKPLMRQLIA